MGVNKYNSRFLSAAFGGTKNVALQEKFETLLILTFAVEGNGCTCFLSLAV